MFCLERGSGVEYVTPPNACYMTLYDGCYCHGCPCQPEDSIALKRREQTIEDTIDLENMGYTVIRMKECQDTATKGDIEKSYITPRDAFHGGHAEV